MDIENKLRRIEENIWEHEHIHHNSPQHIKMRMVVIRLPTGGIWLYSPNPINSELAKEIDTIGKVEHVVSPNHYHHLFVDKLKTQYPNAIFWATPKLIKKMTDISFDSEINGENEEWPEIFDSLLVEGGLKLNEIVFFHKPSKSLICADFITNSKVEKYFSMKIFWNLMNVIQKLSHSLSRGLKIITNDTPSKSKLNKISSWDIKRVVMAHGDIFEPNEKQLKRVYSWLEDI